MSRPTPETDALISKAGFGPTAWEWRQHSRRLERERDEAREHSENEIGKLILRLNKSIFRRKEAERERDEARDVLKRIAHASMSARHKEEDYAEWEKAVESLQGICEEKNFINE